MEKMLNNILFYTNTILASYMEAFVQSCSVKIGFLKISQNSQEITFTRGSFLKKSQAATLLIIDKETPTHVFSCYIAKFSRIFFKEHRRWLLLTIYINATQIHRF